MLLGATPALPSDLRLMHRPGVNRCTRCDLGEKRAINYYFVFVHIYVDVATMTTRIVYALKTKRSDLAAVLKSMWNSRIFDVNLNPNAILQCLFDNELVEIQNVVVAAFTVDNDNNNNSDMITVRVYLSC